MNESITSAIERVAKKIKGVGYVKGNVLISFPKQEEKTNRPLTEEHEKLRNSMIDAFGGVTIWEGEGCWRDENNRVVCEPVRVYYSAHNVFRDEVAAENFINTLKEVGEKGKQNSIFLNAEGTSFFFSPSAKIIKPKPLTEFV
jgi:hypothetical protein